MKMVEVQAGLGFGIKKFRLVWVFETPAAFDSFVNSGWELGAQATAAAQLSGQGAWAAGAMPISQGVWLYLDRRRLGAGAHGQRHQVLQG